MCLKGLSQTTISCLFHPFELPPEEHGSIWARDKLSYSQVSCNWFGVKGAKWVKAKTSGTPKNEGMKKMTNAMKKRARRKVQLPKTKILLRLFI